MDDMLVKELLLSFALLSQSVTAVVEKQSFRRT